MHDLLGAGIARSPWRVRAAAQAAYRSVEAVRARGYGGQHIGQCHAARVVEMQGQTQRGPARLESPGHLMHLAGIGHARGIAQRDALHAQVGKALHPGQHLGLRHIALHGAAEAAGQRDIDRHTGLLRRGNHLPQGSERLTALHAQIAEVVRLADRHDQIELVRARLDGALGAAHIGHQCRVDGTGSARYLAHHDLAVAQCRNRRGRDKGRDFDLGQTRLGQRIDQGDLVIGGHKSLLHLQTVARADFIHEDAATRTVPDRGTGCCCGAHWMMPFSRSCAICSAVRPSSTSTASVSSPTWGALARTVPGVSESLGTMPGTSTS